MRAAGKGIDDYGFFVAEIEVRERDGNGVAPGEAAIEGKLMCRSRFLDSTR